MIPAWPTTVVTAARYWRDRVFLRLPLYGNLYSMILTGRFTRIMATLLKSGVTRDTACCTHSKSAVR